MKERSRPVSSITSTTEEIGPCVVAASTAPAPKTAERPNEVSGQNCEAKYPERFAQEALGHNSKAVHRAYSRRAQVKLPSLESYERQAANGRIIQMPQFDPAMH